MADTFRTEQEQLVALRKWWDDNGRSTLLALALALSAGFGWQAWQKHGREQAEQASGRYGELVQALGLEGDAGQSAPVRELAEQIKQDFAGSIYAQFATLHLAREAVLAGDLAAAEAQLRQLLSAGPASTMTQLIELRLARVMAAQGKLSAALEIVQRAPAGTWQPAYAEVEGDIYRQLGEPGQAVSAYERAVALTAATAADSSASLQLKLQALTPIPARPAPTEESSDVAIKP